MLITVFTPTIRPDGAIETARSVAHARSLVPDVEVRHVIIYWPGAHSRERLADWLTAFFRETSEGWLFGVDDDNRMHPEFLITLVRCIQEHPDAWAFLFGMAYPQFRNGILRPQLPPRGGHVDGGQVALRRDYAALEHWRHGGYGDGQYLAALYDHAPDRWVCVPDVVTFHNNQVHAP